MLGVIGLDWSESFDHRSDHCLLSQAKTVFETAIAPARSTSSSPARRARSPVVPPRRLAGHEDVQRFRGVAHASPGWPDNDRDPGRARLDPVLGDAHGCALHAREVVGGGLAAAFRNFSCGLKALLHGGGAGECSVYAEAAEPARVSVAFPRFPLLLRKAHRLRRRP
jgi:hypothetical protein